MPTQRNTTVARNGRTTPKRAKPKTTYDIDAEMLDEFGEPMSLDDVPTVDFGPIFGEHYRLLKELNAFNMSALGDIENDSAVLQRFMLSMVHPNDQGRFKGAMARQIALNAERLVYIMKRMVEAVADGNPTTTSSGSGRSSSKAAGKQLSAGSNGSTE